MPDVNVDNTPVSIQLSTGESTTVPSGETWRVSISFTPNINGFATSYTLQINGKDVAGRVNSSDSSNSNDSHGTTDLSTVVTEGDTLAVNGIGSGGPIHIGGFVV